MTIFHHFCMAFRHWRPTFIFCNICQYNLDYIIKYENAATETPLLLKELALHNSVPDMVIQVGGPKGIARFFQRAGRSGHRPGETSRIYCLQVTLFRLEYHGVALCRNKYFYIDKFSTDFFGN